MKNSIMLSSVMAMSLLAFANHAGAMGRNPDNYRDKSSRDDRTIQSEQYNQLDRSGNRDIYHNTHTGNMGRGADTRTGTAGNARVGNTETSVNPGTGTPGSGNTGGTTTNNTGAPPGSGSGSR